MTLILLLFLDFLLTTLGLKIILFILSCLGCVVPFSWGLADYQSFKVNFIKSIDKHN